MYFVYSLAYHIKNHKSWKFIRLHTQLKTSFLRLMHDLIFCHQNWEATQRFVYKTSLKFRHLAQDVRLASENDGLTAEILEERTKKKLGELLQLPSDAVDLNKPMTHYGVDSLMAMELITWSSKELGLGVTQLEVLNGMTAASLLKKATLGLQ